MTRVLAILLLLAGCRGFQGPAKPRAICGVQSRQRHQVGLIAGPGVEWAGGARVRATWEPTWGVDDADGASIRTPADEWMGYKVEAEIPVP